MRTLIVLILAACLALAAASPAALSDIHKVYLMPMASGFDQYLAERLTTEGVFTVVVDPKQADAVFSERVDPAFGEAMQEVFPAAKAAPKEKKPAEGGVVQEAPPKRSSSRARGNIFLVAIGSRQVIWSTFHRMDDPSPKGLHRRARDIVKDLKKEMEGKKKD
jgi:hypothetical protein